jgi:hypothetical protein
VQQAVERDLEDRVRQFHRKVFKPDELSSASQQGNFIINGYKRIIELVVKVARSHQQQAVAQEEEGEEQEEEEEQQIQLQQRLAHLRPVVLRQLLVDRVSAAVWWCVLVACDDWKRERGRGAIAAAARH